MGGIPVNFKLLSETRANIEAKLEDNKMAIVNDETGNPLVYRDHDSVIHDLATKDDLINGVGVKADTRAVITSGLANNHLAIITDELSEPLVYRTNTGVLKDLATMADLNGISANAVMSNTRTYVSANLTNNKLAVVNNESNQPLVYRDNSGTLKDLMIKNDYGLVSVKSFGAKGDGVTDDTAAFTSAIANNRNIYVPAGTYKVSIDLPSFTTLYGDGVGVTTLIPTSTATYVIRIDATSVTKNYCTIRDMTIRNINFISNCVGILFNGIDYNSINDWHVLTNLWIRGFDYGIKILGRQIWSSYYNVHISGGIICLYVDCTNAGTAASFNENSFIQCRFTGSTKEGIKILGICLTLTFQTCDIEFTNTSNTVDVAGVYIEKGQVIIFDGCYWEGCGAGVPVDLVTLENNSYAIKFGVYSISPRISNCYINGSGILVYLGGSVRGGSLENCRLTALNNVNLGYVLAWNINYPFITVYSPFVYYSTNFITDGSIYAPLDVNGNCGISVNQPDTMTVRTDNSYIDLTVIKKCVYYTSANVNVVSILNRVPGSELWIRNDGAGNVSLSSSLISSGDNIIPIGSSKKYIVGGGAHNKKLIEMADGKNTSTFTLTATSATTISNGGVLSTSFINYTPTNAAAATLMNSTKSLYVSSRITGTSFTVATADGTSALGTETFVYSIS